MDESVNYKKIFNDLDVGFYRVKLDGTILNLNPAFNKILGLNHIEDLIGSKTFDFWQNIEDRKKYLELLTKNGVIRNYVVKAKKKNGEKIVLQVNSHLIKNIDGIPMIIEGTFTDITEKFRLKRKLEESETTYRNLIDQLEMLLLIIDRDGVFQLVNEKSAETMGGKPIDFIGKSLRDVFPKDVAEKYTKMHNDIFKTGKGITFEHTLDLPLGPRTYYTSEQPIKDIDGNIIAVQIISLDITEPIITKQKLEESEEKLKRLNKELEQRVEERTQELKMSEEKYRDAYERSNFYKDLFTHDISNILSNIKSSVELLSIYQKNPETINNKDEILDILRIQYTRGIKLVSNVRTLSQLDEAKIILKNVEVRKVLDEVIKYLNSSFQERKLNIQVDNINKKLFVQADDLLIEVFENILINAVKYNDTPIVELLVRISKERKESKKYLKIEFIDNGIGIADDLKELIFQKGYKNEKGSKGMGFGLSLVKKIMQKYNGQIWVEDKVKGDYTKGSNFVVLIPEAV